MKLYKIILITFIVNLFCNSSFAINLEKVKPGVLRLLVFDKDGPFATGSSFIIGEKDGKRIIVTNAHVIQERANNDSIIAFTKDGNQLEAHSTKVVSIDTGLDIAFLEVEGLKGTPLILREEPPNQADEVFSIGYPGLVDDKESLTALDKIFKNRKDTVVTDQEGAASRFVEASISRGGVRRIVKGSWPNQPTEEFLIIEHDVNIGSGNSGGPLVNELGEVIGINTQIATNSKISGAVRKSCHVSAVIDLLKKRGIQYKTHVFTKDVPHIPKVYIVVAFVFLLSIISFIFALKKQKVISETYTQFLKRSDKILYKSKISSNPFPFSNNLSFSKRFFLVGRNTEAANQVINIDLSSNSSKKILIGRDCDINHICINNSSISNQHISLSKHDNTYFLEDRNSSNATKINGIRVKPFNPIPLSVGDKIQIGEIDLTFETK